MLPTRLLRPSTRAMRRTGLSRVCAAPSSSALGAAAAASSAAAHCQPTAVAMHRRHVATQSTPILRGLPVEPTLAAGAPTGAATSAASRPTSPPPMELPGFLQRAVDFLRRRAIASPNAQAAQLYTFALRNPLARPVSSVAGKHLPPAASTFARESLGLPTDELTQYRLVGLHIWIIQKALILSASGPPAGADFLQFASSADEAPLVLTRREKDLIRHFFENFWADLTPFLLEARGEIMLTKTLASVQQYFYGAMLSLDYAWLGLEATPTETTDADASAPAAASSSTPPSIEFTAATLSGREALAAALWRNYYICSPTASKRDVYRLIFYIHKQIEHLLRLPKERLWYAERLDEIDWLPTHEIFAEAESDRRMAARLLTMPEAWAPNTSFDAWQQTVLSGQIFDTRKGR